MTSHEFRDRLARRARRAKAHLRIEMLDALEAYFRVLRQWNAKINLTALPLDAPTDETFDRLLIEPLAASRHIEQIASTFTQRSAPRWFDLGSGGGSPAIPLKIARPTFDLTMVESKERKSAFLREVQRALGMPGIAVRTDRFEVVAGEPSCVGRADLVTVRAVRTDESLFESAQALLKEGGHLLMFRPGHSLSSDPQGFKLVRTVLLTDAPMAYLSIFKRMFHVEHT